MASNFRLIGESFSCFGVILHLKLYNFFNIGWMRNIFRGNNDHKTKKQGNRTSSKMLQELLEQNAMDVDCIKVDKPSMKSPGLRLNVNLLKYNLKSSFFRLWFPHFLSITAPNSRLIGKSFLFSKGETYKLCWSVFLHDNQPKTFLNH